jgi:CubicO group peptidase (beta-lactamase class C family)
MLDTGYAPEPELRPRIAATEHERDPDRGVVWGQVHDENAWSLDGVAGHAGVFSTAADLARLARVIIDRGRHPGGRLLEDATFAAMITNQTPDFAGHDHGLGFEINQPWYMGRAATPDTIGHTGYTGTSLVIDLQRRAYVILLTNRVHPSREWGVANPARVIVGDALADVLAGPASAG